MKTLKYKLIIFNLDGTILNTLDDLYLSTAYALKKYALPARTRDEVQKFIGNGVHKLIERAVPSDTSDELTEEVYNEFCRHYFLHSADNTKPYSGIIELLKELKNAGCALAVVSNKKNDAVKPLCDMYFPGIFDIAVGERDGIQRKPAPDSVFEVLCRLGYDKIDSVYIGDSEVDIQTAQNAGIDCISVSWGFKDKDFLKANGAQSICDSVDDMMDFLLQ